MTAGIYRFINNRTGEVYVGQSFNVYARCGKHYKELTLGTHHNRGLQEDYDDGDTFTFEVLEKISDATKEELGEREMYYIEKFNSFYEGYNQTPGGKFDKYKGRYEYGGDRLPSNRYKPVPKPELLESCPKCGGEFVKRKGKYGYFAGCRNYPVCDFTCSLKKVKLKPVVATTSYTRAVPKYYSTESSIKWKTCDKCGKKYNSVAKSCPYCRDVTGKQKTIIPVKSNNPIEIEFKKFCSQKKYYLTKADCDYLAGIYGIDISNIASVKKANPIITKHLIKNNQWDSAMKKLYDHYYHSNKHVTTRSNKKTKFKINDPFKKFCDEKNYLLTKADCDYLAGIYGIDISNIIAVKKANSIIKKYLNKNNQWDNAMKKLYDHYYPSSKLNDNQKSDNVRSSGKTDRNESTKEIVNYYSYWDDKLNTENNSSINKTSVNKSNVNSSKGSGKYVNIKYCSNCGSKLDLKDEYCWKCGEKINGTNKQKNIASNGGGVDYGVTALMVIIFFIFILAFGIASSGAEGPISTIASLIFVSILCFGCYAGSK